VIDTFVIDTAAGTIDSGTHAVAVTVPYGTDVSALTPTITISSGASISPASGVQQDFTSPVTYTVTAADSSTQAWTVTVTVDTYLRSVSEIAAYISAATSGDIATNPIPLPPVSIDLDNGWTDLLAAIETGTKFVELDLSDCTMSSGPEFIPGTANTGESKIVSLILPDFATNITPGTDATNGTFKNFIALTSVTGAGILSVRSYAFAGVTSLKEVEFPLAETIETGAFTACTSLEEVILPAVTSIFAAFQDTGTANLAITLGPVVPVLGEEMFDSVTSKTVAVSVPSGVVNYGTLPFSVTGTDTADVWGNGFRGGGWNGSTMADSSKINDNITLTITELP
jgi:hypothetical protein